MFFDCNVKITKCQMTSIKLNVRRIIS